jgi:hypothetical protein
MRNKPLNCDFCEPCLLEKMKKQPFHRSQTISRGPLDIISSDVGGPVNPTNEGGYRYWIVLVDHYGSHPWVLFAHNAKSVVKSVICIGRNAKGALWSNSIL